MATGQTVTVGCKYPNGVILHLTDKTGERREVRLKGAALRPNVTKGFIVGGVEKTTMAAGEESMYVQGGSALTHGVDAEFWAAWKEAYKDWPPFKAGLIFAHERPEGVTKMAEERRELVTGLEPINPDAQQGRISREETDRAEA